MSVTFHQAIYGPSISSLGEEATASWMHLLWLSQVVHLFTCSDIDAQDYILLRDAAPDMIYGLHLRYDFKNRDDDGRISEGKTRRAVVHAKRVPSNIGHVPAYFKLPHQLILCRTCSHT